MQEHEWPRQRASLGTDNAGRQSASEVDINTREDDWRRQGELPEGSDPAFYPPCDFLGTETSSMVLTDCCLAWSSRDDLEVTVNLRNCLPAERSLYRETSKSSHYLCFSSFCPSETYMNACYRFPFITSCQNQLRQCNGDFMAGFYH